MQKQVGGHNFAKYAKLGKPLHLVFVEPTDSGKDELVRNLETIAAKHRDESFSWIDAAKYKAQIKVRKEKEDFFFFFLCFLDDDYFVVFVDFGM
jgi:flagellar motor component MotA